MIIKRNPIKAQQGRVLSPQGDPYEYLADEAGNYYTRKRGSNSWNKASGNAASAISKLYGNKPAPAPTVQPEEEEGGNSFGDLWDSAVNIFSSKTPEEKEAEERERVAQRQAELQSRETNKNPSWAEMGMDYLGNYIKETAKNPLKAISPFGALHNMYSALPANTKNYIDYLGNAMLQNAGGLTEDEAYFDVSTDELTNDNLEGYRNAIINQLKRKRRRPGVLKYDDYILNDEYGSADLSRPLQELKRRGVKGLVGGDAEAQNSMLTGMANYYIDDNGDIILLDGYNFNPSYKNPNLPNGASIIDLYNLATGKSGRYAGQIADSDRTIWDRLHLMGESVKSSLPVMINLGKAADFLTPEQIASIPKYKGQQPETKSVSGWDVTKRIAKNLTNGESGRKLGREAADKTAELWNSMFD